MTITAGDVVRATMSYGLADGGVQLNVFHYKASAGVSDTEANVIAALGAKLDASYAALEAELATDVTAGQTNFAKRNVATGKWEQIGAYSNTKPNGSGTGSQFPNSCAAVVRFLTDGLGEQGRKFLSGWDTAGLTDNIIGAAIIAVITTWINSIVGSVIVSGGTMIPGWWSDASSAHRAYNGNSLFSTIIGNMRTRKPGVGL